jgi:Zn-dependent membrane protease YugP
MRTIKLFLSQEMKRVKKGSRFLSANRKEKSMIWILFIGTMGLSLWAMWRVKSVYKRYHVGVVRSGKTGAEVAAEILHRQGIHDVRIEAEEGMLGDHYDPIRKRLVLSRENYDGRTPAALGVSAHECGHAIQHAMAYKPLEWRMAAVGVTTYANSVIMFLPLIGLFTGMISPLTSALIMAVAWGIIMLFNLITLPVEFDASRRAKQILGECGYIASGDEMLGVKRVLDAAAWTYVAAFITSLGYLIYHLIPLLTGGNRSEE